MFSFARSLRRSWVVVLLFLAPFAIADETVYLWPDASPAQLKEDIFGIRFRLKLTSEGPVKARAYLLNESIKNPQPYVKAYIGWISLFSQQWEIPAILEPDMAEIYLKQACAEGSVLAADVLGRAKIFGQGISQDEEAGFKLLEEAAAKGLPRAMAKLGYLHMIGRGGRHDIAYGDKLIRQASALGEDGGLIDVADAFETGLIRGSLPRERAMQYYLILAQKNVPIGWRKLDEFVQKGVSGAVYFRALANVRLGNEVDILLPKRTREFLAVLENASELEPRGCVELGFAYLVGAYVKRDYPKALAYLNRGVAGGISDAQLFLAYAKLMGRGVPKDVPGALAEMERLAAEGNGRAALHAGGFYYWGASEVPGLKKDPAKAFKYIQQAVQAGFFHALSSLGECYEQGIGVPKNYTLAAKVYAEARDRGIRIGKEQLLRNLAFVKD